jgi:multimeric flavodoxin WrbA
MKKLLIIQTSLNEKSKTAIAVEKTYEMAKNKGLNVEVLDLRRYDIQMCN